MGPFTFPRSLGRSAWGRALVPVSLAGVLIAAPFSLDRAGAGEPSASDVAEDAGIFEVTTSWSLAVQDYDHDGLADFVLGRHGLEARIYRNTGGAFEEVAPGTLGQVDRHDCAWADVNDDGSEDMYCSVGAVMGTGQGENELWIQDPANTFVDRAAEYGVTDPYGRGRWVTFLDVNHDPYPDLFVGNKFPRKDDLLSENRLFINDDGASFLDVDGGIRGEVGALCAQAVDENADGWDDLLVCGQKELKLYENQRDETFAEVDDARRLASQAMSAQLADLDGDGRMDLVGVRRRKVFEQIRGHDGLFMRTETLSTLRAGRWVAVGDFNGDGAIDLFVVQMCKGGRNRRDLMLLNDGSGHSYARVSFPQAMGGCGDVAAAIDYDQDGLDDVVVLNGHGKIDGVPAEGPVQLLTTGTPSTAP